MSSIRKSTFSNCEKLFLVKNVTEWTRLDGRSFDEFRNVEIKFGKDWGSCFVSLGETRVLAQVSCEIQQPKSSRPSEGILFLNIELNPIAAPQFESGRQSDLYVQLNRLLEKCLKDSKAIDLESLCIKMNEKVWALRVDINVLNHEGNILDCASIAALTAIAHFRRPDVTCDGEEFIIHSYKQRDPIPMVTHHYPVCVTYSIFCGGDYILADPSLLEEGVADAFLSIGLNAYKELCGLHLGGKADLSPDVILSTANKAAARASIVVQKIKDSIEADSKIRQEMKVEGFSRLVSDETNIPFEDLSICLDQWSSKKIKHKKQKTKLVMPEEEVIDEVDNKPIADIESLDTGTAALIPNEGDGKSKAWETSESEDEDVMIIDVPKSPVETVDILQSSSEEETVVVLNANQKTKRTKRKK